MPVASRRLCEYPACKAGPPLEGQDQPGPYLSHVECSTRAEVSEDIKNHVEMYHTLPMKQLELNIKKYEAETDRMKTTQDDKEYDEPAARANTAQKSKVRSKLSQFLGPKSPQVLQNRTGNFSCLSFLTKL